MNERPVRPVRSAQPSWVPFGADEALFYPLALQEEEPGISAEAPRDETPPPN